MTINRRIEIILLVTGAVWTVLFAAILVSASHRSFAALEHDEAGKSAARCVDAITREHEHVRNTAKDWAYWDDTYAFAADGNAVYVDSNLANETFRYSGIDFLYILDSRRKVIYGNTHSEGGNEAPDIFPADSWAVDHPLVLGTLDKPEVSGILATKAGLLLVASCQILHSNLEGPSRGTLVMARLLDDARVADLVQQTHVEFTATPLPSAAPPGSLADFMASAHTGDVFFESIGKTLNAYAVIGGLDGEPAVLVKAAVPRDITARGRVSAFAMVGGMLILLLAFLFVVRAALNRLIVRPIVGLTDFVCQVEAPTTASDYPTSGAGNEISLLKDEFERMLDRLRRREKQLQDRNAELTQAIDEIEALQGILPICACCKKVRDDKGFWGAVESYFTKRSKVQFSHGYCPDCFEKELTKIGGQAETAADQ